MREWLQILALVLVAMCGLLFVQICYDEFRPMLEAGAGGREFCRYLVVTMPSFLGIVLPLALLISLLFALTKLHRANELTAMRAAGTPPSAASSSRSAAFWRGPSGLPGGRAPGDRAATARPSGVRESHRS